MMRFVEDEEHYDEEADKEEEERDDDTEVQVTVLHKCRRKGSWCSG